MDVEVAELLTSTLVMAVVASCDLFPWVTVLGVVGGARATVLLVCLFGSLWAPRAVKKSRVQVHSHYRICSSYFVSALQF